MIFGFRFLRAAMARGRWSFVRTRCRSRGKYPHSSTRAQTRCKRYCLGGKDNCNIFTVIYIITRIVFALVLTYHQFEDWCIDDIMNIFLFLDDVKQVDSMLRCVCSVIDLKGRQSMIRTLTTRTASLFSHRQINIIFSGYLAYMAIASCATFLISPHFDVICDLLLNKRTQAWNLFINFTPSLHRIFLNLHVG